MADETETNPRATMGGNNPPIPHIISKDENFAAQVSAYLADEHKAIPAYVDELATLAAQAPTEIVDDEQMGAVAKLIKRIRDTAAKIEAIRIKEKEPYLRSAQSVDSFFASLKERLVKKEKRAKNGIADDLQQRLDAYNQRKLAEEQARRRREADEAARKDREAREAAERAEREEAERRAAAERARVPERREEKEAAAQQAGVTADAAKVEAAIATDKAEEAHVATLAKPADMVRTRVEDGPMVTMGTEPYAEVVDYDALDKAKLWPHINRDAIDKAVRAWAKTTGHREQMAGASIGKRPKTMVR